MMTRFKLLCATLALTLALPLAALAGADELRDSGKVGERPDGLLGFVTTPDNTTRAEVDRINDARMDAYRRLARKEGVDVDAIRAIAGEKQINRLKPGQYFLSPSGGWVQK
ncbi:MAG: hypothetical protein Alpg2KO_04110 [Alphaproteobacteria bacterium]